MVDFANNKSEFERFKSRYNQLFENDDLISNPFNLNFQYFLAFEFDYIYNKTFFDCLKAFLIEIGEKSLIFYTVSPSPVDYFFKFFKKYSVFEISSSASDDELNDIMMKDPGNSPADAIAINSNDIAFFSNSNDWAIFGSRNFEIAIIGFKNISSKNLFLSCTDQNRERFLPISEKVKLLIQLVDFNESAVISLENMIKNYNRKG